MFQLIFFFSVDEPPPPPPPIELILVSMSKQDSSHAMLIVSLVKVTAKLPSWNRGETSCGQYPDTS